MFRPLYAYDYADVLYDDAVALLADDPEGLLQSATDTSMAHAGEVVSNLHLQLGGFELGRDVVVHLGELDATSEEARSVMPIHWEAATGHLLFPTVDATLEVAAMSIHPPMVQVTLAGSYDPPFGPLGRAIDRSLTHRVAEAVILRFVRDVATRLEERVDATGVVEIPDVTGAGPSAPRRRGRSRG